MKHHTFWVVLADSSSSPYGKHIHYSFHERARKGRIISFFKLTFSIAVWHESFDVVVLRIKKKLTVEIYHWFLPVLQDCAQLTKAQHSPNLCSLIPRGQICRAAKNTNPGMEILMLGEPVRLEKLRKFLLIAWGTSMGRWKEGRLSWQESLGC